MIPIFPQFKKIELSDKKEIENYTHQYHPYSDFNFISLWTWDIIGKRMVSKLNDNLVILFTDYETHKIHLSYLGKNKPKHTVCELINYAKTLNIPSILRFIPEESIKNLSDTNILIEEDKNNFDYIYSISQIAELTGSQFKKRRYLAERFLRDNPDVSIEIKKISDKKAQEHIIALFHRWKNKKSHDSENEERAINRILKMDDLHGLIVSALFLKQRMIGFSIDEILPFKYAVSHFFKTDNAINGVNEFFNKKIAQYLKEKDVMYWNWEQDLGIEHLKKSKMNYRPVNFLKKYTIRLINKE